MRKKFLLALGVVVCFGVGGLVVSAATGIPEVDRANATMQLSGNLTSRTCDGEDGIVYDTFSGTWKGGETQFVPDPTDYTLSGTLTVSGIKWTINTSTDRGVLTAAITLTVSGATTTTYTGRLTLVSQGLPSAAGGPVPARGWIVAGFKPPDEGVASDDSLIENVEMMISPFAASGQFGDSPGAPTVPDFSAVTNVAPKALDGTC